jgi:signal peptidase I
MYADKKVLYIISLSSLAVLLLAFLLPGSSGRLVAALLLLPLAAVCFVFIKKRPVLSMHRRTVLLLMAVCGLLYVMIYFMTGLHFGFYRSGYGLKAKIIFRLVLPIAAIIPTTEIIRFVLCAYRSRVADVAAYFICVLAEVLTCASLHEITTFAKFMDVVAMTLLPALLYNLLYHYITRRYGMLPNIAYRAITTLTIYLIPYAPSLSNSLVAFANLFIPLLIYLFIDSLYEKKRRYALAKKNRLAVPITVLAVCAMTITIMVISNQFSVGAHVIATGSMTGEINKGDVAIYDAYDGQIVSEGQVIVFTNYGRKTVHRVVDVQRVNGQLRYYTKGDANPTWDSGYITQADINGLVRCRVAYVGYPTLWLRQIFR